MDQDEIKKLFEETRAFLKGHFELSSGLHSDAYVQCALLLQYPEHAEKLAKMIAENYRDKKITCVIGPALGGVTLAYEVARCLGVKGIFAERKDGLMQLRRGFSLSDDDAILVVEDVVTTGGSVKEVIKLLEGGKKRIIGVASIIDRSKDGIDFGYPFYTLMKMPLKAYFPNECPLCSEGSIAVKPGSKGTKK